MDALQFLVTDVTDQAVTCDVYRDTSSDAYGGSKTKVDSVDVAIFAPSSSSQVVVEGSGDETSFTGLVVPERDENDDLVESVHVNDELRVQGNTEKRFDVRVKDGVPNDLDPELWRLGLDKANSST
jgi:hypothetical protein